MDHEHKIQTRRSCFTAKGPTGNIERLSARYGRACIARPVPRLHHPMISQRCQKQMKNVTMSVFGMLNWFYKWNPKAKPLCTGKPMPRQSQSLTIGGIKGFQSQINGPPDRNPKRLCPTSHSFDMLRQRQLRLRNPLRRDWRSFRLHPRTTLALQVEHTPAQQAKGASILLLQCRL